MKLLLVLLLAAASAFSQVVISVDQNVSKNSDKSWLLAMGSSALLPGMGERYLGEQQFVRPFVWTDIALWFTAIGSYVIGERYILSAHNYAVRHAGLNSDSKSVSMLNSVGDYRSRSGVAGQNSSPDMDEDYNQAMIRSDKKVDEEFSNDIQWDWGSSDNPESTEHIEEFKSRIQKYSHARPFTKESLLYREIFERYYPGQSSMIPDFWMLNTDGFRNRQRVRIRCVAEGLGVPLAGFGH